MITETQSADYWRGQADAFGAIAGMKSTLAPGLVAWAQAQANLAWQASRQARLVQLAEEWRAAS